MHVGVPDSVEVPTFNSSGHTPDMELLQRMAGGSSIKEPLSPKAKASPGSSGMGESLLLRTQMALNLLGSPSTHQGDLLRGKCLYSSAFKFPVAFTGGVNPPFSAGPRGLRT